MLVAFSLGIVGGEVAPPAFQAPLALFLAGLAAMGAILFGTAARYLQPARPPPPAEAAHENVHSLR